MRAACLLPLALVPGLGGTAHAAALADPPPIVANQNRVGAGTLTNGVLTVRLEVREGFWRPQSDSGGGVVVQAFAEVGKPLQIPGPMIRVRSGTVVEVSLHNALGVPLTVHGLHPRPASPSDTVQVAAGATRLVRFAAGQPGTYYYWGTTTGTPVETRNGTDGQLTGALIVDPPDGPPADDRVFVIGIWLEPEVRTGPEPHPEREIMVINGKSWPNTERHSYTVGDAVRWRWINASFSSHPMHLHGFYFRVHRRGDWAAETEVAEPPLEATSLMLPGATMEMAWSPERQGNWVFHCHFAFHVSDELYLAPEAESHASHGGGGGRGGAATPAHRMAGLVLGIHVAPRPGEPNATSTAPPRRIRLLVQQRRDTSFNGTMLGYALHEGGAEPDPDSLGMPGPTLVLRRGQPVAITVVNRLEEPTAVHWHGIELESFPDGVPGWSGTPARIMPPIAPGDSFVAEFVPPRAGTFIYHSHSNELGQILGGLVGPLVVLEGGDRMDAEHDRIFIVSSFGKFDLGVVNGEADRPPVELVAGVKYRFRFINIGDWRILFTLLDQTGFTPVRMVAKDGADLPRPLDVPLNLLTGPGETADFEFTPAAGVYRLEFKQQRAGWIIPVELRVR